MAMALDSLAACDRLAFDTESDSFYRYDERVCLMQFSDNSADYLFDPLTWGLPDAWRALLASKGRTIVLHGGDFDVLSLRRCFDVTLGRVFDTLIAARCLGMTAFGLSTLLKSELDIHISKSEQRSDWGHRPLSTKQIAYARQDTAHLFQLADLLTERLTQAGRMSWVEQDCEVLRHRIPAVRSFDEEGWRKIKGATDLSEPGRQVVRAVYVWRETQAKTLNRAAFRVMGNEGILGIGRAAAKNGRKIVGQLHDIRGVSSRLNQRTLREAIKAGFSGPPVSAVRPKRSSPGAQKDRKSRDPDVKQRLSRLKAARNTCAEKVGLEPSFLISGSVLERIAKEPPTDSAALGALSGITKWRSELLNEDLLSAL
jgi:ribonuclease D